MMRHLPQSPTSPARRTRLGSFGLAALLVLTGSEGRADDPPTAPLPAFMDPDKLRLAVKTLQGWLEEHKADWVAGGNPRRLGYHAPMVDQDKRWWEVQIPVKPVAPTE